MWKIKSKQIILSLLLLCSVGATSSAAYNEYDWQRKDNENFEEWHRGQQRWRQWESESNQSGQELLLPGILLGSLVLAGAFSAILLTKKSNKNKNIINDNYSAEEVVDYQVENIEYPKLNNYTNKKAIEAYNLSLKILNHAPSKFKENNSFLGVSKYKDEHYHLFISNPTNPILSLFIARELILAKKLNNIMRNNILRAKLDSSLNIVEIYNDSISDKDILKMKTILGNYQN